MKEYKVKVIEEIDDYVDEIRYQEVLSPEKKHSIQFVICMNGQKMRQLKEI